MVYGKREKITRSEIEDAMKKFLEKGGKIKTLPEQVVITRNSFAGEGNYQAYHELADHFSDTESI